MSDAELFKNGIHSILSVDWDLKLVTPLCIRSGTRSAFSSNTVGGSKARGQGMTYSWNVAKNPANDNVANQRQPKDDHSTSNEVSELHFGLIIQGNQMKPVYCVPSSSIRGALRNWCLTHLLKNPDNLKHFSASEDDEANDSPERNPAPISPQDLENDPGLLLVMDVFGRASDNPEEGGMQPSQGRLFVEVKPFSQEGGKLYQQGRWKDNRQDFGPDNICRHIWVRGPVDRITHAAKHGGLHQFLEFSPGQNLSMRFRLVNPEPEHVDLIWLWAARINDGTLRFGGLSSIGRGRMQVENVTMHYHTLDKSLPDGFKGIANPEPDARDVLSGVFQSFVISEYEEKLTRLKEFLGSYA